MSALTDQPILILGMHRSGTSFLASLMQSLGVFIGDDLVGSQKGNPRGHYEARPILEFHQQLIAARNPGKRKAFDEDMLVQEPLSQKLSDEERQAALSLVEGMREKGPWGWKEPRTCLFLDAWMELLPQARLLVVYRHPLEVQQSMLRRSHWDLALFPDQAMQAYVVYNRAILERSPDAYVFNANAGFNDIPRLSGELVRHFQLSLPGTLPQFHRKEFQSFPISRALHRLFSVFQPEAAGIFDQLQERSASPYEWEEREDDATMDALATGLSPLLEDLPAAGRAFFMPLLDWWAGGKDPGLLLHYEQLAEAIAGHVRQVREWNEEAAVIFEENKRLDEANNRLDADNKKMGEEFARQQAFLAKQAATQAKVWDELKRTGDSWKEQRDYIDSVLREKQALLDELDELKRKLSAMEKSGE